MDDPALAGHASLPTPVAGMSDGAAASASLERRGSAGTIAPLGAAADDAAASAAAARRKLSVGRSITMAGPAALNSAQGALSTVEPPTPGARHATKLPSRLVATRAVTFNIGRHMSGSSHYTLNVPEDRMLRALRSTLGRYVHASVVDDIVSDFSAAALAEALRAGGALDRLSGGSSKSFTAALAELEADSEDDLQGLDSRNVSRRVARVRREAEEAALSLARVAADAAEGANEGAEATAAAGVAAAAAAAAAASDPYKATQVTLPRGGTYVRTRRGAGLQFGMPPETIKDCMVLGLQQPTYYVLPLQRFDRAAGLNVAEFEFPAYFNFFIRRGQMHLIVGTQDEEDAIRACFQETLIGPTDMGAFADEFVTADARAAMPDMPREMAYFGKNPFKADASLTADTVLSFIRHAGPGGTPTPLPLLAGVSVTLAADGVTWVVEEDGDVIARVQDGVTLLPAEPGPPRAPGRCGAFEPPRFGVTFLGSSHGFDAYGTTNGFVIWANGRGILVDPPPYSAMYLGMEGISPWVIDTVIITHCHADHDAGTFQKVLHGSRVTIMTAPTVLSSFVRKYAAIAGLKVEALRAMFDFAPGIIGAPVERHGVTFKFFYALHPIPCVGFEAHCGGKSLVFSADTCNDPARIVQMCADGVMSEPRRDALLAFPWRCDVILHEAGIPPIHTPLSTLSSLPADVKARLYCCHVSKRDASGDLRVAACGVENTIVITTGPTAHAASAATMSLAAASGLLARLPLTSAADFLHSAIRVPFEEAETIICGLPASPDSAAPLLSGIGSAAATPAAGGSPEGARVHELVFGGSGHGVTVHDTLASPSAMTAMARSPSRGFGAAGGLTTDAKPGEGDELFYLIEQGAVEMHLRGGREGEVVMLGPGEVFGGESRLLGITDPVIAVAATPCKVLAFARAACESLLRAAPAVRDDLARLAAARARGGWATAQANALLKRLPGPQLSIFLAASTLVTLPAGTALWETGVAVGLGRGVGLGAGGYGGYLIMSGTVTLSSGGAAYGPGALLAEVDDCGKLGGAGDGRHAVTATATTAVEAFAIGAERMAELLHEIPGLLLAHTGRAAST